MLAPNVAVHPDRLHLAAGALEFDSADVNHFGWHSLTLYLSMAYHGHHTSMVYIHDAFALTHVRVCDGSVSVHDNNAQTRSL